MVDPDPVNQNWNVQMIESPTPPITLKWLDAMQFVGIDSTGHGIVLSTRGEGGKIGVKPSDLLPMALAGCTAVDVVAIMHKKQQQLTGLEIRVDAPQAAEPPWAFQSFHLHYILSGHDLDPTAIERSITLAETKYCSIAATVRQTAPITWDYEIVETEHRPEPALLT